MIALLWLGGSLACGGARSETQTRSARSQGGAAAAAPADKVAAAEKKPKRARRGAASSTGTAWRGMTFFVPDVIDGYRARTASEGHDIDLGSGVFLSSLKRAYGREDVLVEIELLDAAHCERVRHVFGRTRDLTRESASAVMRPHKVKGFKAVTQWFTATRVARTSVLVAERFLVNVSVKPADSPAPSLALVDKLDWAGLEKLASQPTGPAEPVAEPIEPSAAPAPAANSSSAVGPPETPEAELPNASEAPEAPLLASQPGTDPPAPRSAAGD